jgi:uncharacterized protein YcfJ
MKRLALTVLTAALATAGIGTAAAQRGGPMQPEVRRDVARVVAVDDISRGRPGRVYQQCWNESARRYDDGYYRDDRGRLYREKDDGTAGAVIGAIIGGALGNQVGDGRGRTAATVAGVAAGAAIGSNIDENDGFRGDDGRYDRYRGDRGVETRCRTVQTEGRFHERYRVTYVYGGQTYRTITRQHPGRNMPVLVEVRPQDDYVADYRR